MKRQIFIGGTGRSGTSVMAKFINSHKDCVLPIHENKIIVETGGLRSVVEELSQGFDWAANHKTIANFIEYSEVMRKQGFRNPVLRALHQIANLPSRAVRGKKLRPDFILKLKPDLKYSLHAVGRKFGAAHYDACIEAFKSEVILDVDRQGVLDTEGMYKPLYTPRTFERERLIDFCRTFLGDLYAPHLAKHGAAVWCDDTPLNVRYSEFLLEVFPDAGIIHMVRHPMDVFASYLEQSWTSSDFDRVIVALERYFAALVDVQNGAAGGRIHTVKLEDICRDFEVTKDVLSSYCGISPDGFDGSIVFSEGRIDTWREKIPKELHEKVRSRLAFAIDYYGYD